MSDVFLMDHGAHYHSTLYRHEDGKWRDAPPGDDDWELEFDDVGGHPVDCFGLPLFGNLSTQED